MVSLSFINPITTNQTSRRLLIADLWEGQDCALLAELSSKGIDDSSHTHYCASETQLWTIYAFIHQKRPLFSLKSVDKCLSNAEFNGWDVVDSQQCLRHCSDWRLQIMHVQAQDVVVYGPILGGHQGALVHLNPQELVLAKRAEYGQEPLTKGCSLLLLLLVAHIERRMWYWVCLIGVELSFLFQNQELF